MEIREYYWMIIVNEFPVEVSRLLFNLTDEDFLNTALGNVANLDNSLANGLSKTDSQSVCSMH